MKDNSKTIREQIYIRLRACDFKYIPPKTVCYDTRSLQPHISNSEAIDSETIFVPGFSNAAFSNNQDL